MRIQLKVGFLILLLVALSFFLGAISSSSSSFSSFSSSTSSTSTSSSSSSSTSSSTSKSLSDSSDPSEPLDETLDDSQRPGKRSLLTESLIDKVSLLTNLLAAKDQELHVLHELLNKTNALLLILNDTIPALSSPPPPTTSASSTSSSDAPAALNFVENSKSVVYANCLNPEVNQEKSQLKRGNIVMFKTHKTGSTTLGSIMFRFGAKHGRRFLLGGDHYTVPLVDKEKFIAERGNLHISHHVTDHMNTTELMEFYAAAISNPTFVSVLRNPRDRYLSAYNYFWEPFYKGKFASFLADKRYINQQSKDFGIHNASMMDHFLGPTGEFHQFGPVVITEKYDESLVLLKREFGWDLEDILYMRLLDSCSSGTKSGGRAVKCEKPAEGNYPDFAPRIVKNNELDQRLYDAFLKVHQDKVSKQDSSFAAEVEQFKAMKEALTSKCRDREAEFINDRDLFFRNASPCTQYVIDDLGYESLIRQGRGVAQYLLPETTVKFN